MKKLLSKINFTTIVGVCSLFAGLGNFFGLLPNVSVDLEWYEHLGGFLISLAFIYVPEQKIKASVNRLFDRGVKRVDDELQGDKDKAE